MSQEEKRKSLLFLTSPFQTTCKMEYPWNPKMLRKVQNVLELGYTFLNIWCYTCTVIIITGIII